VLEALEKLKRDLGSPTEFRQISPDGKWLVVSYRFFIGTLKPNGETLEDFLKRE